MQWIISKLLNGITRSTQKEQKISRAVLENKKDPLILCGWNANNLYEYDVVIKVIILEKQSHRPATASLQPLNSQRQASTWAKVLRTVKMTLAINNTAQYGYACQLPPESLLSEKGKKVREEYSMEAG